MNLYEFEGKKLFEGMGIPIPRGNVAKSFDEAKNIAKEIGYPVVIKCQVMSGGRGKAGGIKFPENEDQLHQAADELFALEFAGEKVENLLVEEKIAIAREFYMGITLDPQVSLPVLMLSSQGGMDIEEVAEKHPDQLYKFHLDPIKVYQNHHMIDMVINTGLKGKELLQASKILYNLIQTYFKYNAITAEINPLVIDAEGKVLAADSKVEIDDSAMFRLDISDKFQRKEDVLPPLEEEARIKGISYVGLDGGNVGLISGGAGLGMASMDMIFAHGGKPANFLDLGGGATKEKTADALRLVLKNPDVEGILINVFGGINNCEKMAQGISLVVQELKPTQAIVVKMRGHSQDEGWSILKEINVPVVKHGTTEEAVILLLEDIKKRRG